MKKYIYLIIFFSLSSRFSVELLKNKAYYDIEYNNYVLEDDRKYLSWNKSKDLEVEEHNISSRYTYIRYKDKNIYFIKNKCLFSNNSDKQTSYQCGKTLVFDKNEKRIREYCSTYRILDLDVPNIKSEYCGTEIQYQPDGTKKIIEHKRKCKDPCELHFVKRHQGLYTVFVDALRVREKPSEKSKTLFTIYKNQEVELLEDTQIFFKVGFYVAPWVKIKTKNGRIGYVYGAFLKTKELYVEK